MKLSAGAALMASGILLLPSCAGGQLIGVKGSPRRACYDAGLTPGSAEFSNCWRNIAHSQGTVVFDDPAAIEAYIGIAAVAAGKNSTAVVPDAGSALPSNSGGSAALGRQYYATRTADDLYDLTNGPVVATRYCHVYAHSSPAMLTQTNIVFLSTDQSCTITQIYNR